MTPLTETMIRRGWAWRVPKHRPDVAVLVSPAELHSLGHGLQYQVPTGEETFVPFEERRKHERRAS